ncbi:hypothetical protein DWB77_05827 [Streptomyces hundungensis]|uniref:Uncharacterized protein n=1 Tax=Streptomyces hundungensis TaxID=1077946 RepID=A0A387HJD1_9ACTN|nr:hypothetical protein [Streptomyces hundungensis]AYG83629.1 hypothetical protein DWB77_05827 [Streptomyces hundungensis]
MFASQPPGTGYYTMPLAEAPPQDAEECGACTALTARLRLAVRERDQSAEVDARVRIRRHMRQEHDTEIPLPSTP